MIFPEDVESPYKAELKAIADEAFDFFKADREFKPKATAPTTPDMGGGYPSSSMGEMPAPVTIGPDEK